MSLHTGDPTVSVIGLGYVGLPAALMWAQAGLEVIGVDVNEDLVAAIASGQAPISEVSLRQLLHDPGVRQNLRATGHPSAADVFVIAVPTPVDSLRKVSDLSHVEAAVRSIAPFLRPGNLVIIESTIPPMTCRNTVKPLLEELTSFSVPEQIRLAHCPERILPGDIVNEIVFNERLIGGMDQVSTQQAMDVYRFFVKGDLHATSDLSAELAKLMENAYRDVNIAIANEFRAICEDLGSDAHEVIALANFHPRVNILQPGIGVGGHCIPVDPWFLKEVAPYNSTLITAARAVNDHVPARMAQQIRFSVRGVPEPKIVLLGAAYKRNCEDTRESPAIAIFHLLRGEGLNVDLFDPLVSDMDYGDLTSVAAEAHLLVVLVAHDTIVNDLESARDRIESVMARPRVLFLDH